MKEGKLKLRSQAFEKYMNKYNRNMKLELSIEELPCIKIRCEEMFTKYVKKKINKDNSIQQLPQSLVENPPIYVSRSVNEHQFTRCQLK